MNPLDVVIATAGVSAFTVVELQSDDRHQPLTGWRQAGMAAAHQLGFSYPQAAHAFGRRDHTTAIYAARKADPDRISRIVGLLEAVPPGLPSPNGADLVARVERLERLMAGPVQLRFPGEP